MKRVLSVFVLCLCMSPAAALGQELCGNWGAIETSWCPGGECIGDLDLGDFDLKNPDDIFQEAPTTDAAPDSISIQAGHSYNQATGGNQTGANLNLSAGIGTRQVTIDDYNNCGTDTVTVTINGAASVLTEASEWTAATDNSTTATSLASAVTALSGVTATSSGAVVYITPTAGATFSLDLAEGDATCTTLTEGADGDIRLYGFDLLWDEDGDSLWNFSNGYADIRPNNTLVMAWSTSNISTYKHVVMDAAIHLRWYGRVYMSSAADGQLTGTNSDQDKGATLDFDDADGQLTIKDRAGTGAGNLHVTGKSSNAVDADTIADSGDANPATHTLTPTSSYVELTCNDAHTCDITMGETGILEGTRVTIVNVSANTCDFADTGGVTEIAGAFAAGQYDSITLVYSGDTWIEVSRSNN